MAQTALAVYTQFFQKAASGAGSRGGHVIGTTKSGKPIYAASSSKYRGLRSGRKHPISQAVTAKEKNKGFTREDHQDATTAHIAEAKGAKNDRYANHSFNAAEAHAHAAQFAD